MKRHKAIKIVCVVLAVLVVLSAAALGYVGNFFYNFALNPNSDSSYFTPAEVAGGPDGEWLQRESADAWHTSEDGLKLHAYRVDGTGHRYVVLCHGYQNNATGMASYARHFNDLGCTVVLPDARGHGRSEGDYIGMGWDERRDIVGWVNDLVAQDPEAQIVLMGVSMGGATVMMASGEADLSEHVKCVVEDCGYTDVKSEFSAQLKALYGLPSFPVINALDVVCRIRAGYSLTEASAVKQVAKSRTPTLFIHGEADTFVPFSMLEQVYGAASCEKEKLAVPGAAHAESRETDPELYWGTVDRFVEAHMA